MSVNHDLDHDQFAVNLVTVVGPLFRPRVGSTILRKELKDVSLRGVQPFDLFFMGRVQEGQGRPRGSKKRAKSLKKRAKGIQKVVQELLL